VKVLLGEGGVAPQTNDPRVSEEKRTPLHVAAYEGCIEVVQALLAGPCVVLSDCLLVLVLYPGLSTCAHCSDIVSHFHLLEANQSPVYSPQPVKMEETTNKFRYVYIRNRCVHLLVIQTTGTPHPPPPPPPPETPISISLCLGDRVIIEDLT
jgi:hypothetical protein